jgi:hypothetical protein
LNNVRDRFDLRLEFILSPFVAFSPSQLTDVLADVGQFIERRRPKQEIRDKLDYRADIRGMEVVLSEVRPRWDEPETLMISAFAKIKWVQSRKSWRLYWMRASGKWESYTADPTFRSLKAALAVVSKDEYGCFFG